MCSIHRARKMCKHTEWSGSSSKNKEFYRERVRTLHRRPNGIYCAPSTLNICTQFCIMYTYIYTCWLMVKYKHQNKWKADNKRNRARRKRTQTLFARSLAYIRSLKTRWKTAAKKGWRKPTENPFFEAQTGKRRWRWMREKKWIRKQHQRATTTK